MSYWSDLYKGLPPHYARDAARNSWPYDVHSFEIYKKLFFSERASLKMKSFALEKMRNISKKYPNAGLKVPESTE